MMFPNTVARLWWEFIYLFFAKMQSVHTLYGLTNMLNAENICKSDFNPNVAHCYVSLHITTNISQQDFNSICSCFWKHCQKACFALLTISSDMQYTPDTSVHLMHLCIQLCPLSLAIWTRYTNKTRTHSLEQLDSQSQAYSFCYRADEPVAG